MDSLYLLGKMAEWKMKEMEQFYSHNSLESKKEGYMFQILQVFKVKKPKEKCCCCC
jgi:hypothetical protein